MGTTHRLWSTEPLWLWRLVVVLSRLVVAGAVAGLAGGVVALLR